MSRSSTDVVESLSPKRRAHSSNAKCFTTSPSRRRSKRFFGPVKTLPTVRKQGDDGSIKSNASSSRHRSPTALEIARMAIASRYAYERKQSPKSCDETSLFVFTKDNDCQTTTPSCHRYNILVRCHSLYCLIHCYHCSFLLINTVYCCIVLNLDHLIRSLLFQNLDL